MFHLFVLGLFFPCPDLTAISYHHALNKHLNIDQIKYLYFDYPTYFLFSSNFYLFCQRIVLWFLHRSVCRSGWRWLLTPHLPLLCKVSLLLPVCILLTVHSSWPVQGVACVQQSLCFCWLWVTPAAAWMRLQQYCFFPSTVQFNWNNYC